MSEAIRTNVLVVGGGPGGYVAAIRAGQLGLDTTLVEAERLGGTCLIRGCIPSKALIHVAGRLEALRGHAGAGAMGIRLAGTPGLDLGETVKWKDSIVDRLNGGVGSLLRKHKVRVLKGWASFSDGKTCTVSTDEGPLTVSARHVILATGSKPVALPELPFGDAVISSTEALALTDLPGKLVVVGAGYIGVELGIAFRKLGSQVSFVEAADRILPHYDAQLAAPVRQWLARRDVAVHLGAKAQRVECGARGQVLLAETAGGKRLLLPCDKLLVTVGRQPLTEGWGRENMALELAGSFVRVDDQCRTSMRDVWAIGDVVGEPMLAHKAAAQGEMVAEIIAGRARRFDPAAIPSVCFSEPELVGVGLAPDEARAQGHDIKVGVFPLAANGRSLTMEAGADGGFVRITARSDNHVVLGIHAAGAHVAELSGEFAQALEMGARLEDLARTIHVHPTVGEAVPEAALAALGHALHI